MPGSTAKGVPYILGTDPAATIDTVMQSLAEWLDARPGIASITEAARDALAGADLWVGQVIYNTTVSRLEMWNGATWTRVGTTQASPADGNASLAAGYPVGRSFTLTAQAAAGWPTTDAGLATTTRFSSGEGEQIWVSLVSGLRYSRVALGGVWGAWAAVGGGGGSLATTLLFGGR